MILVQKLFLLLWQKSNGKRCPFANVFFLPFDVKTFLSFGYPQAIVGGSSNGKSFSICK